MLIAHLSDPHVRPDGSLYQGVVDSNAQFAAAIAHVNALDPRPDLMLLSGDLVDHGHADEYAMLARLLAALEVPVLAIPGNHDEREAFRAAFTNQRWLPANGPINYAVGDRGPLRIVAFDVTLPGLHHGIVSEEGAAWLHGVLAAEPARPTIVMMHQPPFDTGIPYMDPHCCREGHRRRCGGASSAGRTYPVRPCPSRDADAIRRHDPVHGAVHHDGHRAAASA